jgi:ABC-type multidrug transport system permease subunit
VEGPDRRGAAQPAVSRRAVDIGVALAAFLVGLAAMWDTHRLGASWEDGSPQSGYFPFRIGAIVCITAAVIAVRAFRRRDAKAAEPFVTWDRLRLVLAVLVPMLGYMLAIHFAGLYAASAVFIAAFMVVGGRFHWLRSAVVAVAIAVTLFWLFEIQFLVPLPKGPVEALIGY